MGKVNNYFGNRKPYTIFVLSIFIICNIALLCSIFESKVGTSNLLYLVPVLFSAWYGRKMQALLTSTFATLVWALQVQNFADLSFPVEKDTAEILLQYFFSLTFALLVATIAERFKENDLLANKDSLTDAHNLRAFRLIGIKEIDRAKRLKYPLSLAFMDLDNFKMVNDSYGHSTGDRLLCTVVKTLMNTIRQMDIVARIGGDEFAVLFIGLSPLHCLKTMERIQSRINEVMTAEKWPVTMSTGLVCCDKSFDGSIDDLVEFADSLMYKVKYEDKNAILYSMYNNGVSLEMTQQVKLSPQNLESGQGQNADIFAKIRVSQSRQHPGRVRWLVAKQAELGNAIKNILRRPIL